MGIKRRSMADIEIEIETERGDRMIDDLEHNIQIDNIFDMFDNVGCMYVTIRGGRLYRYLNRHFYIHYDYNLINVLDENVRQVYEKPYSWDECDSCYRPKRQGDKYHINMKEFRHSKNLFKICKDSFNKKHIYENEYENY